MNVHYAHYGVLLVVPVLAVIVVFVPVVPLPPAIPKPLLLVAGLIELDWAWAVCNCMSAKNYSEFYLLFQYKKVNLGEMLCLF